VSIKLKNVEKRVAAAIAHYWTTLESQAGRQTSGDADRGRRSAVTGGKQMHGFCDLVCDLLKENGLPTEHIHIDTKLDLPGYFRASKVWDMLVVRNGRLLAALEFKSQRGPSFGNNFNNRTEEAIGTAVDLWTAFEKEALGKGHPRPWLGWLMLLEDSPRSTTPVRVEESHFPVFPEFRGASYAERYELLLRRLVLRRLYDGAAFLMATERNGPRGLYTEPAADLNVKQFLSGLVGHVAGLVAAK
jgi:type II restriction enzyme